MSAVPNHMIYHTTLPVVTHRRVDGSIYIQLEGEIMPVYAYAPEGKPPQYLVNIHDSTWISIIPVVAPAENHEGCAAMLANSRRQCLQLIRKVAELEESLGATKLLSQPNAVISASTV